MNIFTLVLTTLFLFHSVISLNCDKDELSKYNLQNTFNQIKTISTLKDTPPSKTNFTWFLNLCNQVEFINEDCPKNSQICGIQEILLPGESNIKSQIISIGNGLNYKIDDSNSTDLIIKIDETSWGSNSINSQLNLHCSKDDELSINWEDENLSINWFTPGACLKDSKDTPPPKDDKDKDKGKDKDDSWGWFTWLFILFVLFFGVYIIFGAWLTTSRSPADFQDALHDFVETLKNLFSATSSFLVEVFQKITGTSPSSSLSSSRGGYSAV